jgi:predicted AlkP superfamily pyrophosphatase or phosphodiesterase
METKTMRRNFIYLMVAGLLSFSTLAEEPTQIRTPKVVFIIIDGIPADVIESTATPAIDNIAKVGGYTRAYVGGEIGEVTESPTSSAIGYNHLLTGTWSNKHNVWTNDIKDPNYAYWDIFRIAKTHDPALQTAVFSTWLDNRTKLIGDGLERAGGKKIDYAFDGFEHDEERFPHDIRTSYIRDIDELVANEAARYIRENGPDLSWVYLQYTDNVAHFLGDGDTLKTAVIQMDDRVDSVWDAVRDREQTHEEDWLIIVTTDHGRDSKSGRSHGGQSARERTTWISTNSTALNARFHENPAIVDILPSIATHLKLVIPPDIEQQLEGQSFIGVPR